MQPAQVTQEPTIIQRLQDKFMQAITTRQFPVERLSHDWFKAAFTALHFASPPSLGISQEEFIKLANKIYLFAHPKTGDQPRLSLFQFATVSNNLESKTPNDLGLNIHAYCDLLAESGEQVKYYTDTVEKLRKELEHEIAAEDQVKKAAMNGAASSGGLKQVVGEA